MNRYYQKYKMNIPKYLTLEVFNALKDNSKYTFNDKETELALFCLFFEILRLLKDDIFIKLRGFISFYFYKRDVILKNYDKKIEIKDDLKFCKIKLSPIFNKKIFTFINKGNDVYYEHVQNKIEERNRDV